ncbi:MAG TPA: hypothetical protein VK604_12690 [Bryobacteraceae bacterium]|nr:hypothetical protein [Bryobacteraceae bacterium]
MASRRKTLPGLTRREWSTLFAAAPLVAQTSVQVPAATAPAETAAKAVADVQQTRQKLAEIQVPMSVEPSFRFVP